MLSPPSAVGPGNRKTMPGLTTTGEAHLSLPQANSSSSKPSLHHATSEKLSSLQAPSRWLLRTQGPMHFQQIPPGLVAQPWFEYPPETTWSKSSPLPSPLLCSLPSISSLPQLEKWCSFSTSHP
ncbi:uncharacterized protein LOC117919031 isoform X1 [Vitis riparia]|uniref:uncharacterized protein LOC117917716 isoform X1 n=1 Tax=Vitis riparia TaxID=96939 RepID=UPI00155AB80D|nr:uncharacterized protein LOC117917716 isoform X1 [Vitis riparia]XP_034691946.1 uncharacterized protein LOC117919031 isoform X1 [Vitis riparia]